MTEDEIRTKHLRFEASEMIGHLDDRDAAKRVIAELQRHNDQGAVYGKERMAEYVAVFNAKWPAAMEAA